MSLSVIGAPPWRGSRPQSRFAPVPEPNPSVLNLLKLLVDSTRRGTLNWKVAGDSAFVATRPFGSVAVASLDGDGNPPFVFQLLNPENNVLEEVAEDRGAMNSWDPAVEQLYRVARDNALSISTTVALWVADLRAGEELSEAPTPGWGAGGGR